MNIWKRSLSMVLALVMALSMVPMSVFAVDDNGVYQIGDTYTTKTEAAPDVETVEKAIWVLDEGTTLNPNPKTSCGNLYEHTHDDSCYTKSCDHKNGHLSTCYGTATSYALCPGDDHEHAGTVTLADVVTISGTNVSWKKDHPAYPAVYAVYKAAYDEGYANARYWKDSFGKAAGVAALTGKTFCYTVETSAEPDLCTHTCSEVGGSCYTKTCLLTAHTHDTSENGCYEYRWTLKADANGNNIADDAEIYTVVYTDGVEGEEIFADQTTSELAYGAETPAAPSVPTREHYEFAGWSPEVAAAVTAPAEGTTITYTATWTPVKYTITWVDEDGNKVLYTQDVAYNETPVYGGETPDKADTAEWDYSFSGWTPTVSPVTGVATYKATYSQVKKTYTVTWVDENGTTVLETDSNVEYGTIPEYNGETPTKEDYTFAGWDKTISAVTGDVTYKATYTANTVLYTFTFVLNNGQSDITVTIEDGKTASEPANLIYEGYRFIGWYAEEDFETEYDFNSVVTTDTTVYAKWVQEFTVSFNGNGAENPDAQKVLINEQATEPTVEREGYVFLGWFENEAETAFDFTTGITANVTLTAKWGADTDKDGYVDGSEEDPYWTVTYTYGIGAENYVVYENQLDGCEPPVPSDPELTGKLFAGWDSQIAETVNGNLTYNATWVNDVNGNEVDDTLETITVAVNGKGTVYFGTTAVADGTAYVYDSTKTVTVTVVATPSTELDGLTLVSNSYVSEVAVDGTPITLTYSSTYSVSYNITANDVETVSVTFTDAGFVLNDERVMNYYDGMTGVKNEDIYNAIVASPAYGDATDVTVQYMARPAITQPINIDELNISDTYKAILKLIYTDGVINFSMDALWLDVDAEVKESVPLSTAVSTYLTDDALSGIYRAYLTGGSNGAQAEMEKIFSAIYDAALYYGAHPFGYNNTTSETVTEAIRITYKNDAMCIETETDITLKDMRQASFVKGENVQLVYKDYTDEELLAAVGAYVTDADGNSIEGATVYSLEVTAPYTFEGKNASETTYELTMKFAGNDAYKPSEATFTVTIAKAPASIDLPDLNVTYGDEYSAAPEVTLGNKYGASSELTDSMIQFIVGLDVAELDVNEDGVTGLNTNIQLILPADLQSVLDTLLGSDSTGVTMSLSELTEYLQYLDGDSVAALKTALESLSDITETGDIQVTIGGSYPTDIGVYLYGAVTTNSNYETAYDVGYIIIKPDAEKVYLDFNYKDTNGIFTWELLQYLTAEDLGASAYSDEALTSKHAAATALVQNLYFGIDDEGNLLYTLDASTLGNGAYTQIAFIADFGNEMVYAEPIVRAFVIVPNLLDVEIVDGSNNAKDLFTYEFDNTAKQHYVTLDGERVEVQIHYVGIQTNTNTYKSTQAPKRAGAYAAYVTYLTYNDDGELTGVGFDAATVVIAPTESTINVDSKVVTVQPGVSYDLGDLVTAGSTVPGLKPDTTIISALISTDGTYSENGWEAVEGNVNVDFPAWVDGLIAQYAPSVVDGITVGEFTEKLLNKLPQINAELEAQGIDASVIDALNEAVNAVADKLAELPDDTTLSFKDDVTVSQVGVYLVVGVVTDSDHIPAVDAGVLVITPDVTQVELKWNYEDGNGIWTKKLLQYVDLNASAFDIETGKLDENATAKITYKFISISENGDPVIYDSAENLPNGMYIELAYIELELDGEMVVSDMIARVIVLTPDAVDVNFHDGKQINNDRKYTYDGKQHDMGNVIVTELDGTVVDTSKGELTVTYIGVGNNGERYNSTVPPVSAGVYTVIATYVEYDENGEVYRIGTGVGALAIEKAPLDLDLEDTTVTWDGNEHFVDVTNPHNGDYVTVIIDRDNNLGNIILEDDLNALWALVEEKLETEIPDTYDVAEVLAAINEILATAEEYNALLPEEYQGYGVELLTALRDILATLPQSGTITVNGAYPSEIGTYECYGLAYSNNYKTEASRGYLEIVPIEIEVTVDNSTKFYGEEDPTPSYTVKYYDHLGNELTGFETDVVVDITREEGENVGKYTYTATVTVDDEHYVVTAVTVDAYLEIIPAEVTITVDDASKFYGDEDPTNDPDVNVTSGKVAADELNVQISREEGENVGEYDYIVNYTESDNWNVTVEAGALTINPAEVTITVNDTTKVYGESDPANDVVVNVTSGKVTADELNVQISREDGENVGEYDYIVNYTESDNWNVTVEAGALTITPAKVTITVNDASKVYGETDPANNAVVNVTSGKVTVDELNVEVTRKEGKDAGEYDYIVNYTESDNWDVTVEAGKLTIDPAEITVTVSDASKIYGQEDPTIDYSVVVNSGVVSDEELELSVGREAGNDVGTYNYTVSYTDSKNWIVNTDGVGSLTITKATVTITIKDNEIEVNNTVPAVDYDIDCDGVVTDEELALVITWNADTIGENVLPGVYEYEISYNDPTAPDNWDVIVENDDATLTVTIGDYVCWNMQTGVYYDDLSDALDDVDDEESDTYVVETIQMLKDYKESYVIVAPGTTLDLNGFTVTAKFVTAYDDAHIIDSTDREGLLAVKPANISLSADNAQMSVYTEDAAGYKFFNVKMQQMTPVASGDSLVFRFRPSLGSTALNKEYMADGSADNGLKIGARMTYTDASGGTVVQDFFYDDEKVAEAYSTNQLFLFSAAGIEGIENLTIASIVVADSGVECVGAVTKLS